MTREATEADLRRIANDGHLSLRTREAAKKELDVRRAKKLQLWIRQADEAITDKAIPGGTEGFPLTLQGCVQERERVLAIVRNLERQCEDLFA